MLGRARKKQGQTMVETALAIPFLMLMLLGVIYFGYYFYIANIVSFAAQQGAITAGSTPDLQDSSVRDSVRGFSPSGQTTNTSSLVYNILASASLLNGGMQGSLPTGAQVLILPYDGGTASPALPAGAVAFQITYPFKLFGSSSNFTGTIYGFPNLNIVQQAAVFPQVYEESQ